MIPDYIPVYVKPIPFPRAWRPTTEDRIIVFVADVYWSKSFGDLVDVWGTVLEEFPCVFRGIVWSPQNELEFIKFCYNKGLIKAIIMDPTGGSKNAHNS